MLSFLALASGALAGEPVLTHFPASGEEMARLEINGATDIAAMRPLILDFQQAFPRIAVNYSDFLAKDLAEAADRACAAGEPFGDIVISSAVDQLVKFANDGCAQTHVSEETRTIPNTSTVWRDEVFGFTFEPIVMVYNPAFIAKADVPRSRNEFAELLRREEAYFQGKVVTYDLRVSDLGYLLSAQDAQQNPIMHGRLLESMGRVGVQLECCTSAMLADIASGKAYIGYNLLGSYAYAAARDNPSLKIVLPRDYTLILHRAAAIPASAPNRELAGRFLDYLLSDRGQAVSIQASFFFSRDGPVPTEIDGPTTLMASGVGRTITIRPTLLAIQDRGQRERFIAEWSGIVGQPPN
jgi:iron(III) transport system substrate-binding protein